MLPAPRSFLLASLLLLAGLAHAQDYEIRLNRPSKVGDRYHIVTTCSDNSSAIATVDGQAMPPRNELIEAELAGDIEVLEVTPKGQSAKYNLVIEKFVRTDAKGGELLPAGTTVLVEFVGGRTTFKVGGEPTGRLVSRVLEMAAVNAHSDDKAMDDQVFGTTERKKVGDSWPINAAVAAADLVKMNIPATPDKLSGQTTLAEALQQDGQKVLRLTGSMEMNGVSPQLPPGVEVQKSSLVATMSGLFPVDLTKQAVQAGTSMTMEVKAGGTANGRTMEMQMSKKTTRETKITAK